MAKLPITTKLKTESLIEDQELVEPPRSYFGISGIGHNCARALWYTFGGALRASSLLELRDSSTVAIEKRRWWLQIW